MNGTRFGQNATLDSFGALGADVLSEQNYSSRFFTMAGFDALIQLRIDVLESFLSQNVPGGVNAFASNVPYQTSAATQEIDELIANRLDAALEGGHTAVRPISVEARLFDPTVVTLHSEMTEGEADSHGANVAEITWEAAFRLEVERAPSRDGGIDLGQGDLPARGYVDLASGTVQTFGYIRAASQHGRFVVWAELHFIPMPLSTRSHDALYTAMMDDLGYRSAIEQALGRLYMYEAIRISPRFSFPTPAMPHVPIGEAPTIEEPVAIQLAITRTLADDREVLALCMNAPPAPSGQGDAGSVVPFLTTQNYSCALSFGIVRSVVLDGWKKLPLPDGHTADVQLEIKDPDDPANVAYGGRARIRLTMVPDQPEVSLSVSGPPFGDSLRLVCSVEVQLLEFWDENGDRVDDLGDLAGAERTRFSLRLQLFDEDPGDVSPVSAFLNRIAAQLLRGLYEPTSDPIQLSRIEGVTLSARGVVFLRGNLS
jgi:hypothetical protein